MRRLTLVRHASAEWRDAQIADCERPLDRRGTSEAAATARALLASRLVPDLLVASPAARTRQTAEILARELGIGARRIQRDERLYLARPEDILAVVRETGPRIEHLMIVGHNPGISALAYQLAGREEADPLATAALCTLRYDIGAWPQLPGACASEARFEAPARSFRLWA